MSSDDFTRSQPGRFQHAGAGMHPTMLCIACGKRRPLLGAGVRFYSGVRQRVCANCKPEKKETKR